VTDLATAAGIFGLSSSTAYALAAHGRFPVPVLRFGNRYRIPVAAILTALHLPATDPTRDDLTGPGRHASIDPTQSPGPPGPGTPPREGS